jgi:hypothetical protein
LRRLISGAELRRQLGRDAEAYVRRHFSIERVVDDLTEVYRRSRGAVPARLRVDSAPSGGSERSPERVAT